MSRRKKAEDLIEALYRVFKYYNVYIAADYNQCINIYDYDEDKILIEGLENDKEGVRGILVQETREKINSKGEYNEN